MPARLISKTLAIKAGKDFYIGKACKHHRHKQESCKRRISNGDCIQAHVERSFAWNQTHKDKHNASQRKRKKLAPELRSIAESKRRAIKAGCYVILTPEERQQIRDIYIRARQLTSHTGIKRHVDHIIPLCKGGLHHPSNLQILTEKQNLKKGKKMPDNIMQKKSAKK